MYEIEKEKNFFFRSPILGGTGGMFLCIFYKKKISFGNCFTGESKILMNSRLVVVLPPSPPPSYPNPHSKVGIKITLHKTFIYMEC